MRFDDLLPDFYHIAECRFKVPAAGYPCGTDVIVRYLSWVSSRKNGIIQISENQNEGYPGFTGYYISLVLLTADQKKTSFSAIHLFPFKPYHSFHLNIGIKGCRRSRSSSKADKFADVENRLPFSF